MLKQESIPAVVCHASLCLVDDISGAFIIFIHPTLEGEMNEDKASGGCHGF
ncbi:hypothetical protein [Lysinibacillus pakistanensis]|uniref:Uncharacterized protein n=1 Tax=Lysinibacillus pakistanensis TaxID=759811 RepID=A0ABX6D747_9BACI|nr:hypothetical protein GDS87_04925 [Lysinibacillus pakistanensis]